MPSVTVRFERAVEIVGEDNLTDILGEWLGHGISVGEWMNIGRTANFFVCWRYIPLEQTSDARESIMAHILKVIDSGWVFKMVYEGSTYECDFSKGDLPKTPQEIQQHETQRMVDAYTADEEDGTVHPDAPAQPKTKFKAAWGI